MTDPVVSFASAAIWRAWLANNHASSTGVWLKLDKGKPGALTYAIALDEALCFGWIDGRKRGFDDDAWLQRFTPRTKRSKWSRINRDHAERLVAEKRMTPAGLREIEAAKKDGRFDAAYAGMRTAGVPPDLQKALDDEPAAAAFFRELDSANRYAVLYRVNDAKKPETRAKRIETFVAMLARGETLHPPRKKR